MGSKTCKHRGVAFDHLARDVGDGIDMEYRRCCLCDAWLSLGESDEHASEQVEIEIRAAELLVLRGGAYCTNDAWAGWHAHERGWEPDPPLDCQAAWLALEVWEQERREDPCPDGPHCGCPQHYGAPDAQENE